MGHLIRSGSPLLTNGRPLRSRDRLASPSAGASKGAVLRSRSRGFTFVELMVVVTIVVILITMAVPIYSNTIRRSKESVLKQNLFTLRTVIDNYTYDKQKAPAMLEDLVRDGYLYNVPVDPMTGSNHTWRLILEDPGQRINQADIGIYDVRSGSDHKGLDGTLYSEWQ